MGIDIYVTLGLADVVIGIAYGVPIIINFHFSQLRKSD
jgi:hypothetical protein